MENEGNNKGKHTCNGHNADERSQIETDMQVIHQLVRKNMKKLKLSK